AQQLQCRVEAEADMRGIISKVTDLPVVSKERRIQVAKGLEHIDLDLKYCDSVRERDTFLAQRETLLAEQKQLESTTAEWHRLRDRLIRYQNHPEAEEVLSSRSLDHPLDGTRLDLFAHAYIPIPLHSFNPTPFDSVGRSPLLQGVHPESHLPVVLKPYSLTDKAEMEHA
ncbi:hypothetical protein KIPB_016651, partial [Kipferlia bialata]